MILKATIRNFMGVEKEISIDCLANNKIKRNNSYVTTNDDGLNFLKTVGIIGSNGSGKTSILNAFATLQTFIAFPSRKSINNNKSFLDQIKKLPDELLEQILNEYNTLSLPEANVNHSTEETFIQIEMYIPKYKENISGYYIYTLIYDENYKKNGVKKEKLIYKKKHNSKKEMIVFEVSNIIESELGTKLLYQNNTIGEDTKLIPYYKTFGNEIMDNVDFVFDGYHIDISRFYNKNKDKYVKLCNLADDKIIDTAIEKKDNEEKIVFINNKNNKLYFEQLSEGTKKIIVLGCKIIDAIENNKILFIDELEQSLHLSLANFLVSLFQSNKKNSFSQLFFTTHSVFLSLLLDNDQLYYIDNRKDNYEFLNISNAIKKNIITKDRTLTSALVDNLLIKNPSKEKIEDFINLL